MEAAVRTDGGACFRCRPVCHVSSAAAVGRLADRFSTGSRRPDEARPGAGTRVELDGWQKRKNDRAYSNRYRGSGKNGSISKCFWLSQLILVRKGGFDRRRLRRVSG